MHFYFHISVLAFTSQVNEKDVTFTRYTQSIIFLFVLWSPLAGIKKLVGKPTKTNTGFARERMCFANAHEPQLRKLNGDIVERDAFYLW